MSAESSNPVRIATRGSALALAQANHVMALCQKRRPETKFELRIIKTTGDKMQSPSFAAPPGTSTKGLFTKEIEEALLSGEADLAVHSLKDLPTELPSGLVLGAVPEREDPRDVLIQRRGEAAISSIAGLLPGACVATSSTRRAAQLKAARPDLRIEPIRGNVGTRLRKLTESRDLDAIVLAAAGLRRLDWVISETGLLENSADAGQTQIATGLSAGFLSFDDMLPCVGQGALALEIRTADPFMKLLCSELDDPQINAEVAAERALLRELGGGCQSPVGAFAKITGEILELKAIYFSGQGIKRARESGASTDPEEIGRRAAASLLG
jgi:hydroxymethylbilane synthase